MNTLKTQNLGTSAEAIKHHYDVGNDFYQLWLDSTNTYSGALWEENDANDTLELAQLRKLDFHINQARAKGAKRVLDIGCGWGSTLKRLIEVHDVEQAFGLTLSKAQAEWIASLNLPQAEVKLESWQDHSPVEPYDAIISLEAFEHFTKLELSHKERIAVYRKFFSHCHQWLKPSGWMSLQVSTYGNSRREDSSQFVFTEVLPETDFPTLAEIIEGSERIFEIVAIRNYRQDYEYTLKAWLSRLKANRAAGIELVGKEVVSRFEKYLSLSSICFHQGISNLFCFTLRRIDNPRKDSSC